MFLKQNVYQYLVIKITALVQKRCSYIPVVIPGLMSLEAVTFLSVWFNINIGVIIDHKLSHH